MATGKTLFVIGQKRWNTASRAEGARAFGWDVRWSVSSWTDELVWWLRVPQYLLRIGPDIIRYNFQLLKGAIQAQPDIVWVEEPIFLFASTLKKIKTSTSATLVCAYSDDPRDPAKRSLYFDHSINIYDVIFTTKDELIQYYFAKGCSCPAKFWKGYDPERIYPITLSSEDLIKYRSNLTFIGHPDFLNRVPSRLNLLASVSEEIHGVNIWGKKWGEVPEARKIKAFVHPYQIDGLDYTKAMCASKIVLQIPSRLAHDTHSSRSVEIPASRSFMLAERTTDHQLLFEEDKEAVFFNCVDELIDKARFYIKNDFSREKIAEAGYLRCVNSGYSNYTRMQQMLKLVMKYRDEQWINS